MANTLLKFKSFTYLDAFTKYTKVKIREINLTELTIDCDCTRKVLDAARQHFDAEILSSEEILIMQNRSFKTPSFNIFNLHLLRKAH